MKTSSAADLERVFRRLDRICARHGLDTVVSLSIAIELMLPRLRAAVRAGATRRMLVAILKDEGYSRWMAEKAVRTAFATLPAALSDTGVPQAVPTDGTDTRETPSRSESAPSPARSHGTPPVATPARVPRAADPANRFQARSGRPPLRADPLYYGRFGQPALGATPWRYFHDNPKLPLYAPAAYPMTDAGVPVLDPLNWVAPYGVDETGTPLAPYGVTHRFGYPVRREGVPPSSPLPSPKTHATGEEGWEDW